MNKDTALNLLTEYSAICQGLNHPIAKDAAGMPDRFPKDGSERKAMRWLGYIQGVVVTLGAFKVGEVKEHSRRGYVFEQDDKQRDTQAGGTSSN